MDDIRKMLKDHRIEKADMERLKSLMPVMEKYRETVTDVLFTYIMDNPDTARFFPTEEIKKRHQNHVQKWFLSIFSGDYMSSKYLRYLEKIGYRHVKVGIDVHFINAAMNLIRSFVIEVIDNEIEEEDRGEMTVSVNKILDLNLDVITSSYREEQLKTVFVSYRFETYLIEFAKRFTYGLNLILVVALIFISFSVIGLFASDVSHLFEGNVAEGLLRSIGTLLILWVMIELLDTEVRHLRGGEFAVRVFVGVALVALIRELLLSSFQEASAMLKQYFYVAAIFVLGLVYWLISRAEKLH